MKKLDAMRQVFEAPLSGDEKLVWLTILDHVDVNGWAYPGVGRIAARAGVSESTVKRILRQLESKVVRGLRVERSRGRTSNRYHLSETIELRQPGHRDTVNHTGTVPQPVQPERVQRERVQADPQPGHADRVNPVTLTSEVGQTSRPKKQANTTPRKPRRSKPPAEDPEGHKQIVETYERAYTARRGEKPVYVSRDWAAFKKIRVDCGVERACRAIEDGFRDQFLGGSASIQTIADNPAKYLATGRVNGARASPRPVQGGPAADLSHAERNRFVGD